MAAAATTNGSDGLAGETAIFECKQSRADLLRDTADERRCSERLREVAARRFELEQMLGLHLPDLRRGESLFAECDTYDFDGIRHDGLRAVRREEAMLQGKLFGRTKFDRLRRYAIADRLYLVVEPGVMLPHETPAGWGLLVAGEEGLRLERRPERIESGPAARLALLQAIAMTGTRSANEVFGIAWDEPVAKRQNLLPQ